MMITKAAQNEIFSFEEPLKQELYACKMDRIKKGDVVVRQDSYLRSLPLLLEGSLRVYKKTEDREILFYYIQRGETCGLSLGACMEGGKVPCEIAASQDSVILLVPSIKVQEWQWKYSSWNRYIIALFTQRQQQLLDTFGEIAFSKMEKRIKDYLCELVRGQHSIMIQITHQELANELGTTRVVVSRILKNMELSGAIQLHRGTIKVKKLACVCP